MITIMQEQIFICKELEWFEQVLFTRVKLYFNQPVAYKDVLEILPPSPEGEAGSYAEFLRANRLSTEERICLMLSLVPMLKPQLLDCFAVKNTNTGCRFVEFGCVESGDSGVLLPTFETLLFLLAADNVAQRIQYTNRLSKGVLFENKVLTLERSIANASLHLAVLTPSQSSVEALINESDYSPEFSASFPAARLTTLCSWDDLVLPDQVMQQINEIKTWIEYGNRMLDEWNLRKKIKPGYRVLFYGPSGTGKTFTAALLGKHTGKHVYRVDLSMVVSKYIGETEKNLSGIFDTAENRDWILFFDEADALFGKRTGINDSHDRYANQEISFLLQRIESYNGLVVLSSNLKKNMDEAFIRRFQSIIYFPSPKAEERLRLWQNTFSPKTELEDKIHLEEVAEKYELTGGNIVNIVQYCSLMAMQRNSHIILYDDLMYGIQKEYLKAGKTV